MCISSVVGIELDLDVCVLSWPSRRDKWVWMLAPMAAGVTSCDPWFYLNLVGIGNIGVYSAAAEIHICVSVCMYIFRSLLMVQ